MKCAPLLFATFLFTCTMLRAQQQAGGNWQQQVDYRISATLNDEANTLDAFETFEYKNNSPDTLQFLWVHLWPNAYKNNKSAFAKQKLAYNQTDFYFSGSNDKGYLDNLHFRCNDTLLTTALHPLFTDVVKLHLVNPLLPGAAVTIETPFHVKLPYRSSRLGHVKKHYSLTQWYPKVALYDAKGWHEMPYLHNGEFFNDFGNYEVTLTLPGDYVTAATGVLINEAEIAWMKAHDRPKNKDAGNLSQKKFDSIQESKPATTTPALHKTIQYVAGNVTDFAWFACKDFMIKHDTIVLQNRIINAWNFILPGDEQKWLNSMLFTKRAIRFYSDKFGDYPYPQVSVVGDPQAAYNGMEYPMIAILNTSNELAAELDLLIAHEIGHNWLQGIIASNERAHPWMDEGINSYIENQYHRYYYGNPPAPRGFIEKRMPEDANITALDQLYSNHTDLPIDTISAVYTEAGYTAIVYTKTALWMEQLEKMLGHKKMDTLLHEYFKQWQFKHPYPGDFKRLTEQYGQQSTDSLFALLHANGPLTPLLNRKTTATLLLNLRNTHTKNYIGVAPAFGINNYDKFQIGLLVHNYNVPSNRFQFFAVPMLATGTQKPTGYARASYDFFPKNQLHRLQLYTGFASFTTSRATGIYNKDLFKGFAKITPGVYGEWKKKAALSPINKWFDSRVFIVNEQQLVLKQRPAPADSIYFAERAASVTTVIPQVSMGIRSEAAPGAWRAEASLQLVKKLLKFSVTGHYFLNYNHKREGIAARLFFGKIFYTTAKTDLLRAQTSRYHFSMYGPNGSQDYTYSNAFVERNASAGFGGRQITMRDGGFKYRSDYSNSIPGLSPTGADFFDNWLAAANFTIDIPNKFGPFGWLPFKMPLKVFADVGSSASPWQKHAATPLFLYSLGLQLQLFKAINIYYPFLESKAFADANRFNNGKETGARWWQKRLTFSFNLSPIKNDLQTVFTL